MSAERDQQELVACLLHDNAELRKHVVDLVAQAAQHELVINRLRQKLRAHDERVILAERKRKLSGMCLEQYTEGSDE